MRSLGHVLGGRDPGPKVTKPLFVRVLVGQPRGVCSHVFAVVSRRVPHRLGAVETS